MKLLAKAGRFHNFILSVFVSLAGALLIFLMLSVDLEVGLRYFLGCPTSWVVEIAGYILLFIPFMVAAWVLKREGHIGMDLGLNLFSPKGQHLLNAITSLICAIICCILVWYGAKVAWYLFKAGYKTPTVLMLPKGVIISIIPIGSLLFLIQLLIRGYYHLKCWKSL